MTQHQHTLGIIGAGQIVSRWIRGARQVENLKIVAIACRSVERAAAGAAAYGIPRACLCEELIADPSIEIVYIATPHPSHKQWALSALGAGKHVLVEKPAAVTADDFLEMAAAARTHKRMLMEAMWTNFFPAWDYAISQIKAGLIGTITRFESSFGFKAPFDPESRLFNSSLAGGSLLDVGVYNLHAAYRLLGKDCHLQSTMNIGSTQVDESTQVRLLYPHGIEACLQSSICTQLPNQATIYGTAGSLTLPIFWSPTELIWHRDGYSDTHTLFPVEQKVPGISDEGFQYEIRHLLQCIKQGRTESPILPHAVTAIVLDWCDRIRKTALVD